MVALVDQYHQQITNNTTNNHVRNVWIRYGLIVIILFMIDVVIRGIFDEYEGWIGQGLNTIFK